jgi:cellulose synthase subunit
VLDVDVPAFATAAPSSSVEADVNGTRVAAAGLEGGGTRSSQLRTSFSGRLLRPGGNALSVDYRIGSPPAAGRAAPADGPVTVEGTDALNATLSLPLTEPALADLRLLPYPFLEAGQRAQVVLADGSPGTLTAAAQEMVALGSRTTQPPPDLPTFFASGWNASGDDNLLVVGRPPAESSLGALAAQLPVVFGRGGQVTMSGRRSGDRLRLDSSVGAVQEMKTPDSAAREVLWLDATGPEMLSGAAAAIYDTRLGGAVAVVDQAGRVSSLQAEDVLPAGRGPATAQVAAVAAGVLIVAVLALQVLRPRRSPA